MAAPDQKFQDTCGIHNRIVWMIIPSYFPAVGGAEVQVRLLSRALRQDGLDVRILTRRLDRRAASRTTEDGIPVIRLPGVGITPIDSIIFLLAGLWHLFWHGRRGIYHAHAVGSAGWLAVLAGRWLGGRSLVKLRTNADVYEKIYGRGLARWQFHRLLSWTDRLLVVNRGLERWLLEQGHAQEKVAYFPNSIDANVFFPVSLEQKQIKREHLGLPQDKTVVLYVGRLSHVKGVDVLLEAWAALPEDCHKISTLIIVGDGMERPKLETMAGDSGIMKSVIFTGLSLDTRDYYQAADVFVLPSRAEGLSNALIEAMACALPCVTSSVGGSLDLVRDGDNGVLFESENHNHLANLLADMILGGRQLRSIGQQARQTISETVEIASLSKRLCKIYEELK